jgi:lysylphosphatidylglycerol synthetase-like protein (DUF2156 family)
MNEKLNNEVTPNLDNLAGQAKAAKILGTIQLCQIAGFTGWPFFLTMLVYTSNVTVFLFGLQLIYLFLLYLLVSSVEKQDTINMIILGLYLLISFIPGFLIIELVFGSASLQSLFNAPLSGILSGINRGFLYIFNYVISKLLFGLVNSIVFYHYQKLFQKANQKF